MTLSTAPRQTIIVVGLGYGDESKGATVDYLAATIPDTVAVVRWSGGAQAAHNVRHGGRHHTFNQFGSATFLDVQTILRAPMLVNPILLADEAEHLAQLGVNDPLGLIVADANCLVTTPIHIAMNRARELERGDAKHGSTGLGIGETVAYDLAIRAGAHAGQVIGDMISPADAPTGPALTLGMLRDHATTVAALEALAAYAAPLLARVDDPDAQHASVDQIAYALCNVASNIVILDDIDTHLNATMDAGSVIFEGSQGVLLDEWHGFHPHTTWATITPAALADELRAAGRDPYVLGLTRAYATRHGAGPMPTEDQALHLDEPDNREGRYQGGWRTGHLDLPALRYAAAVAGRVDGVAVSHLDQIADAPLMVARTWAGIEHTLTVSPAHDLDLAWFRTQAAYRARPRYEPLPADQDDLLTLIAGAVGAPIAVTAHGPRRTDRTLVGETLTARRIA